MAVGVRLSDLRRKGDCNRPPIAKSKNYSLRTVYQTHLNANKVKRNTLGISLKVNLLAIFLFTLNNDFVIAQKKFTIPILPDTQAEVGGKPEMFYSQLNWIAQKKDSLNMPIVLHVGDLVNFDNIKHYETASKGYKILDSARIGYAHNSRKS